MGALEVLIEEYPGQMAWEKFASFFEVDLSPEILGLQIDNDICAVAIGKNGDANLAAKWLQTRIPALDGNSALQVFSSEVEGRKIVRSLLMRLP